MNTSESELNLASLADCISQVKSEQNLRRKNIAWLKQYFDELKQECKYKHLGKAGTQEHIDA